MNTINKLSFLSSCVEDLRGNKKEWLMKLIVSFASQIRSLRPSLMGAFQSQNLAQF